MKTICILLCTLAAAVAAPIEEIKMASGRPLQKAGILEVSPAGVFMKHSRGRGLIKFSQFTREGIIQAGGVDLWGPSPGRVKGRLVEPSAHHEVRAVLATDLSKQPHETTNSHRARLEGLRGRISGRVEQSVNAHARLLRHADEQDREGIDSTETRKQAAQELALALTCGYALAEMEAAK